ncbi:MAG: dienelactone hydrolase family protein, partial [Planctomycetaceae bacterium]|nr:dienelactone hydrolase family protein [Planctomycetaceae bacterium]
MFVRAALVLISIGYGIASLGMTDQMLLADEGVRTPRTGFLNRTLIDDDGTHRYVLFVPKDYKPDRPWPLIVFLHGAGERGSDGQLQTTAGLGPFVRAHEDTFPFLVLFPQCEDDQSRILTGWSARAAATQRMLRMLERVETDYAVDPQHRILTGWSMGGYGVWNVAAATPDRWSALVPIAGGGDPGLIDSLRQIPIWAIHGQRDNVIRPSASQRLIDALHSVGSSPWLTILPEAGHDVWKTAYGSKELYQWMLAPTNSGTPPALNSALAEADVKPEFAPVLEIANAAELRLGNRLLSGLSYAIPSHVPKSALSGSIADIRDQTNAEGYWFNVTFSRISYTAQLEKAHVEAIGDGRLQLKLGLRQVDLTIGNTSIVGDGRSAAAGPVSIMVGHQRPAWLSVVVEPYVENRRLRLKLVKSDFTIDPDNYMVTSPWGVSVRGLGMDRRRVSDSIVQGLYSRRRRVEEEVSAAVPAMLKWVEDTLDISDAGLGVSAIWPLPVYRPDVRIWPETVSTDKTGVTIRLGMAAANPTAQPLTFRKASASGEPAAYDENSFADGNSLQLKIQAGVMEPLSQLLVESRAARINVLDIPGDAFAGLTDRAALSAILPELGTWPEETELRTELILRRPFLMETLPSPNGSNSDRIDPAADSTERTSEIQSCVLSLNAPEVTLVISRRVASGQNQWTQLAEFDCSISQGIAASVVEIRDGTDLKLLPTTNAQLNVTDGRIQHT